MKLTLKIVALLGIMTIVTNSNAGAFNRLRMNATNQARLQWNNLKAKAQPYMQNAWNTTKTKLQQVTPTQAGLATVGAGTGAGLWYTQQKQFSQGLGNATQQMVPKTGLTPLQSKQPEFKQSEFPQEAFVAGNEPNKLPDSYPFVNPYGDDIITAEEARSNREAGIPLTSPAEVTNTLMNSPVNSSGFAYYSDWVKKNTKAFANYISTNYTWLVGKGSNAASNFKKMMTNLFQKNPELAAELDKTSKGKKLLAYIKGIPGNVKQYFSPAARAERAMRAAKERAYLQDWEQQKINADIDAENNQPLSLSRYATRGWSSEAEREMYRAAQAARGNIIPAE